MKLISISMEKNHSNPRRYRRSNEQAPGKGFTLNTVLAFLVLLCMYQPHALAQELLFDDGNVHKLEVLPGGSGTRDGSPRASKIYSNTAYTAVSFTIRGGDGGRARAAKSSCAEYGGDGAVVKMTVPIGNGTGEIPPGSEIRFFLGKAGEDDYGAGASRRYGGGGGGSAVTARFPGKTGITDWEILAAAGGGAGAEVRFRTIDGCGTEKAGQGGRDFNWDRSFDGDGGDPGGGVDGSAGGGGGGAYYDGQGYNVIEGEAGFPDGGRGGQYNSRSRGGWGFGGGGGGGKDGNTFHGGGGGGYTGGNATQGGGSWVNPDYDSNPTLIAGGSTSDTDNGYIEYQFKGICSINSVATTAATCSADGSATINVTTACDDNFSYGVEDSSGNLKESKSTKFSGLAAGTYTAYIWRGDFLDGTIQEYELTIPQGTCDTTAPVITLNDDNPMYVGQGDSYSEPGAKATDDIDGDITDKIVIGGPAEDVSKSGTYKVTYDVSDQAGNAAVQVKRTVIVDLTAPVITLNGDNPMYIGQGGSYEEPGATATDDTDGNITDKIEIDEDVVDVNTAGTYKVTYEVSDQADNTTKVERTVIVDLSAPVITLNGNNPTYIGQGGPRGELGATAKDDIDGDITDKIKVGGDAVDVTTEGTYKVTYNVSDQAGNPAVQIEQTVIVDLTAPVITLNDDDPMYIGQGGSYEEPGATATDNTDGDITDKIVIRGNAIDVNKEGAYKVTYNVKDQAGNVATAVTRKVIVDLTAPVITLKGDNPLYIGKGDSFSDPGATVTDNEEDGDDLTNKMVVSGDDFDVEVEGTYTVTYNVKDKAGNAATEVTRTVIVDLTAPVITLNEDNPMYIGQGGSYEEPGATATDDTDGNITDQIEIDADEVDVTTAGTYKVTYDVSDQADNAAVQVERTVIVNLSVPVITLNDDNPMYIGQGGSYEEPGAMATDDIDGDITDNITIAGDPVDVTTAGTYKVTYNVSDQAGNPAVQVERTVIVDLSVPVITLNDDNPMYIGQGGSYEEPGAKATDDTDGDITDKVTIAGDVVDVNTAGTYKVTYKVSDQAGNAATEVKRTVIVDSSNKLSIKSLILVDADTDKDIVEIKNGMVISLSDYGLSKNTSSRQTTTKLNIRVDTGNNVESIKMELSGAQGKTTVANRLPYSLYGDIDGDYRGSSFAIGNYSLTVTPYSENCLEGNQGASMTITFEVK